MLASMTRRTLCAIVGSTGVGKSQLSIELAKALSGQVINGDSMQIYRGADVLTNKVTKDEMQNIEHHLLSFLEPSEIFDVGSFQESAINTINAIHTEGHWPILVGGTHYYIQSLLFQNSTLKTPKPKINYADHPILSAPTAELFAFLQKVDPEQAAKFHPSDRRKIEAKVELYLHTGRPASQLYNEQKENGVDIRWETLIFWVWSERDILNERLDQRVEKMIKMGLEEECRSLYRVAEQTGIPVTSGVFQAIGYREFLPVVTAKEGSDLTILRAEAAQQMKSHTRQYVNQQIQWLKYKLLPQCKLLGSRAPIYILDATDPKQWNTNVLAPALTIAQAFLTSKPLPTPSSVFAKADDLLNPERKISKPEEWKHWTCEVCTDRVTREPGIVLGGDKEWQAHLRTRGHKSREKGLRKWKAFQEWKASKIPGKTSDEISSVEASN